MADYYESEDTPNGEDKANIVHNQPYDESVDVSDGEEIASNSATPRGNETHPAAGGYAYAQQQHQLQQQQQAPPTNQPTQPGAAGGGAGHGAPGNVIGRPGRMQFEEEEEETGEEQSDSEESDEIEDGGPHATLSGVYDPAEFQHLQVSSELKELFQHITRYTPQTIDLETRLKPFIPEYIPAIGDIDAFLKVARPDGKTESLGLSVLDEPCAKQSDRTVLDLQIRAVSKQTAVKPMAVHNIPEPEKQPKILDNWIENISDLHRQKPAANVHYTKNMPDVENLMQEWQPQFEETLKEIGLPTADLDCDLAQYADIICGLLDIPVYKNRIHSLHVLFSLYTEFKNSQHFKSLADVEKPSVEEPRSDSVIPEV